MFGIGFGEILLIVFIIFLICPKDMPKIFKKLGALFAQLDKFKNEIFDIKKEFDDTIKDETDEIKKAVKIDNVKESKKDN